jgi:polyhydroxyalkanoate synthesis regulator phasin
MRSIADVRKYMEAAVGKLTPARAQELARSLLEGQGKDQVAKAAQDLLEWSNKNRQRLVELVRSEVRSQLSAIGVATKDEVDALRKRVRELERGTGAKAAARKPAARKPAARKRTTRKAAAEAASPSPSTGAAGGAA